LTGIIHELVSIDDSDDIDIYFQPSFDSYNLNQPSIEGYRFVNTQNIILPSSVSVFNEALLERHKRDVTLDFDLSQTSTMDGSGSVTEEESKCRFRVKDMF
jgi:hypothetical protein